VYDIHVFYVINLQVQCIINSELIRCLDSVLLKFYQCKNKLRLLFDSY